DRDDSMSWTGTLTASARWCRGRCPPRRISQACPSMKARPLSQEFGAQKEEVSLRSDRLSSEADDVAVPDLASRIHSHPRVLAAYFGVCRRPHDGIERRERTRARTHRSRHHFGRQRAPLGDDEQIVARRGAHPAVKSSDAIDDDVRHVDASKIGIVFRRVDLWLRLSAMADPAECEEQNKGGGKLHWQERPQMRVISTRRKGHEYTRAIRTNGDSGPGTCRAMLAHTRTHPVRALRSA